MRKVKMKKLLINVMKKENRYNYKLGCAPLLQRMQITKGLLQFTVA